MFTVQCIVELQLGCTALAWPCTRRAIIILTHEPSDADLCATKELAEMLALECLDGYPTVIRACEVVPWGGCYASDF
jgi:hypothetical protein